MRGASGAQNKDPYFNYVTMLLHGDGTNGAQNNTFLDSSTNAFSITRNGNITQGSFSPYGSNWSNYFKGSGDYLSNAGSGTTYDLSGDFCVEGFFNFTSLTDVGVWGIQPASGQAGLRLTTESNLTVVLISGNATAHSIFTSSVAPIVGQWNHIAVTRSGSALTLWLNGVSVGTGTSSSWTGSNLPIRLGGNLNYSNATPYYMNGYISNFRIVKGSPVYTTAFTPPTAPLTAITNTQLLTCQSNRFVDNSTNNFTLTVTGTPSVQRFNPFGTATAYSTSVIGGSGYFDGNGDYLNFTAGTTFNIGTGNFTIEFWANKTANGSANYDGVFEADSGAAYGWFVELSSTRGFLLVVNSVGSFACSTAVINDSAWHHWAICRSGSTWYMWRDGVALTPTTNTISNGSLPGSGTARIGFAGTAYPFNGYMSDLRVVNGTALYTTAFTPPTAPLTAISGTLLLTKFQNAAIFDNAMMNDLETVGNAQISTSVVKYGTGSMYFDGTGDYLVGNGFQGLGGNFTIEAWVYSLNWSSGAHVIFDTRDAWFSTTGVLLYFNDAGNLIMYLNSSDRITSATAYSLSTWYHVALVRSGSTITMYVDGTSVGTYTYATALTDKTAIVGTATDNRQTTNAWKFNGYIDDLRITSGYARYTTTFTPPTKALSDTGPY